MTAITIPSVRMIGLHTQIGSQITTNRVHASSVIESDPLISQLHGIGDPIAWYNREEVSGAPP
jgi:hypothetical protein